MSNSEIHPSHPQHASEIHPSHPQHALGLVDENRRYMCNGCKMDGIGKRYTCEQRDFHIHPGCMVASPTIIILGQTCNFLDRPPPARPNIGCKKPECKGSTEGRSCDACGMTILGFNYHCPNTDWDFHPTCVNLKSKIECEDVTFSLQEKGGLHKCAWCKRKLPKGAEKKVPGWSYVSKDEDLNFHVYCVMQMDMQVQTSSSNGNNDLSLALKGTKGESQKTKSKKVSKTKKWLQIFKVFISIVLSILLGDPTTLFASTVADVIDEGFAYVFE